MWYYNCKNCGKQNSMDYGENPLKVKCFSCGMILGIKEGEHKMTTTNNKPDSNKDNKILSKLSPVPPRPNTTGLVLYQRNMAIHKYYEDNKGTILLYVDAVGEEQMMILWSIPKSAWGYKGHDGLRNKWRPEVYGEPIKRKSKRARSGNQGKFIKGVCPIINKEICEGCVVTIAYKGYRQAIIDIFGNGNKGIPLLDIKKLREIDAVKD